MNIDDAIEPLATPPTVGQGTIIDIAKLVAACSADWHNETLCEVNDSLVRLGIFFGEFHWHRHENEDEFFYVVEGELLLDLENSESLRLHPGQGYTVAKGALHRTRADIKTVVLMIESNTVRPRGD